MYVMVGLATAGQDSRRTHFGDCGWAVNDCVIGAYNEILH